MIMYVGTYTQPEAHVDGKGAGIYCYAMDPTTGILSLQSVTTGIVNPSFVTIDATKRFLYAVSEVTAPSGGYVYAYTIDPETYALTYLNRQPSGGDAPCHVSVTRRHVLLANYMGGSVSILPVAMDGSLQPATTVLAHEGSSVHPDRQEAPHPHAIVLDPAHRFALVPDLGTDRVEVYRLTKSTLQPTGMVVALQPGAGPRHLVFHNNGHRAYLISELDSTVTAFSYNSATGALTLLQTIDALPQNYDGVRSGADIHVAENYIYASLRGPGAIAQFAVNPDKNHITCLRHTSTEGQTPRNFALDPTETFLLAANQDSDTLVTFRRNKVTGRLSSPLRITANPSPVCIRFLGQ